MTDWRLAGQERYLSGVALSKRTWRRRCEEWDHDHCEFCFAKLSESENDLHQGYATEDEQHWICEACYGDFRERFEWQVSDERA